MSPPPRRTNRRWLSCDSDEEDDEPGARTATVVRQRQRQELDTARVQAQRHQSLQRRAWEGQHLSGDYDHKENDTQLRSRGRMGAAPRPSFEYDLQTQELSANNAVAANLSRRRPQDCPPATQRARLSHDPHEGLVGRAASTTHAAVAAASETGRRIQTDVAFASALRAEYGWEIVPMVGDGACLFRAVETSSFTGLLRVSCIWNHQRRNRDHFQAFVTTDFDAYLEHKARPTTHGNHVEIQAMSEIYNRRIEVYSYDTHPINIFQGSSHSEAPIRLSYHGQVHYNAINDPQHPSFGIGLGLPGLRTLVSTTQNAGSIC
ncbi:uncharacterized protein MONBRDRAFT_6817 [Monosiga brevicollis MX1]|uniref:ubiquitinyl hydrolase 1 n=1 Tax=Monosiga brevicollis TaxID=81824 RepID=A9UUC0_MONBE|nr:uncharacterized protein MONBRDRAFT_6817 [Monosiga brevicollis MX1]EDQ91068.1 predicted protein [Monosiga brevicollis MX1]|eukprot:XP_001744365.1 hypothetical protein [Monosiga brevicollis MX1]